MKKGTSDALAAVVNRVLKQARTDGTYDELYEKWFGVKPKS